MPRDEPVPASAWSLDYQACTLVELRKFIRDRTAAALSDREIQRINKSNKDQLTNRLHKLDQESTFPRFMELPPELRVNVYEVLLMDARERNEYGEVDWSIAQNRFTLHPAVLRVSKQIYSEAQPILYKQNKFDASLAFSEEGESININLKIGCLLKITKPGSRSSFSQTLYGQVNEREPYLRDVFEDSAVGMLRMLSHLTIDLSLVTPGEDCSHVYVFKACAAIASLCLSLTGASKMKELTINVEAGHPERDHVDLARILWPLMFLRTDIAVKFKGIAEVPVTFMTNLGMHAQAEAHHGRLIARVRRLCSEQIEKHGWDDDGLRGVEEAIHNLSHFGEWFIRIDDIVNLSKTWTGMRRQADLAEAQ